VTDTRRFAFGGYTLDPVRRLLFDAKGATIPLSSRAFDTLLCFLDNPGALLTKQALMKAIWPDSIVEENNLNQSILALRRALGETPGEHRFIVTVTGRGYRFVAPVQLAPVQLAPEVRQAALAPAAGIVHNGAASPRGWWITRLVVPASCLAVLLLAQFAEHPANVRMPTPVSIAVLPFVDLTADRAQQFLADGIANELLLRLADRPNLKVVSRTASFAMASRAQDLRSIGRALGANRMLEGSIRAAGEELRVSVQLIDTVSGAGLWSQTYERRLGDALLLQQDLAHTISAAIAALPAQLNAPSPPDSGRSSSALTATPRLRNVRPRQ
jgi:TolB-like protein/DNA-binding winged helix-turn-helix (wHTH) protein